jgi:hypothetical protein
MLSVHFSESRNTSSRCLPRTHPDNTFFWLVIQWNPPLTLDVGGQKFKFFSIASLSKKVNSSPKLICIYFNDHVALERLFVQSAKSLAFFGRFQAKAFLRFPTELASAQSIKVTNRLWTKALPDFRENAHIHTPPLHTNFEKS